VSKSALIEVARAKGEAAQYTLWATLRDGSGTVRDARQAKRVAENRAVESSPIGTALRAGRRFAAAISALPAADRGRLSEVEAIVARLVSILDERLEGT